MRTFSQKEMYMDDLFLGYGRKEKPEQGLEEQIGALSGKDPCRHPKDKADPKKNRQPIFYFIPEIHLVLLLNYILLRGNRAIRISQIAMVAVEMTMNHGKTNGDSFLESVFDHPNFS